MRSRLRLRAQPAEEVQAFPRQSPYLLCQLRSVTQLDVELDLLCGTLDPPLHRIADDGHLRIGHQVLPVHAGDILEHHLAQLGLEQVDTIALDRVDPLGCRRLVAGCVPCFAHWVLAEVGGEALACPVAKLTVTRRHQSVVSI